MENSGTFSGWARRKWASIKGLVFTTPRTREWAETVDVTEKPSTSSGREMETMSEFLAKPYTPPVTPPFPDDRQPRLIPWPEIRNLVPIQESDDQQDQEPSTSQADQRQLPQEPNVPEQRSEESEKPNVQAKTETSPKESKWNKFKSFMKRNK